MPIVESNGIHINYTECGSGDPLVLLMGLGADGSKWHEHVDRYQQGFRCICIDNRGAGKSDKPEMNAYSTRMMAEDTIGVMDHLQISSAHVAGISMGGAIAQHIAISHPERVRSMVLISTFARPTRAFVRAMEVLRDVYGEVDGSTFTHLLQWMIYSHIYHEEHLDDLMAREEADMAQPDPMPAHAFRAQCNACITHDTLEHLHEIGAPVLVAGGECDLLASEETSKQLANEIPFAELYIAKNGGHTHHWEQLDTFNQVTYEFLINHTK